MKNEKPPKSASAEKQETKRQVAYNRRARFEYEIMETYEAGLELAGTEVKSIREGRLNLQDAFCRIEHNEAFVHNMHINPYEQGNIFNVEPRRKRRLLLHRWQILELKAKSEQKGLTIVPLSIYFLRGFAKMEIALAKGKKLYDKRDSIAERDQQREQQRQFVRGGER